MNKTLVLIPLLFLLPFSNVRSQQIKTFTLLERVPVAEQAAILEVESTHRDTLRIYMQHVSPDPSDQALPDDNFLVEEADKVVWCYPQKYGSKKHLMPDVKGKIYVALDRWKITFMTKGVLSRMPEDIRDNATPVTQALGE